MNNFFVYILVSQKLLSHKWSYVGYTGDLEQRITDHQKGKTKSTKAYRPLSLIHTESFDKQTEARKRELFLKSGCGREERYQIIKNYYSGIV